MTSNGKSWSCGSSRTSPSNRWPASWTRLRGPSNSFNDAGSAPCANSSRKRTTQHHDRNTRTPAGWQHPGDAPRFRTRSIHRAPQLAGGAPRPGAGPAPAPRADLAALLTAGAPGAATVPTRRRATTTAMPLVATAPDHTEEALPAGVSSLAERRGRKRRLAIVGGAVVGAMTLGAGAVAASSEDFRDSVNHTVGVIFQPSGETPDVAPKPAKPSPTDIPATPAPSNAAGATAQPTADDVPESSRIRDARSPRARTATPPAIGRGGILPTPPHRPVTPGCQAPRPGRGPGPSRESAAGADPSRRARPRPQLA